jgi:ABC-type branched-subunit amino acid transport system ATPase component
VATDARSLLLAGLSGASALQLAAASATDAASDLAIAKMHLTKFADVSEQSMLAIARALMTNPSLLVMDEPSEGLAPQTTQLVGEVLSQIKQEGLSILLAEQNLSLALEAADEVYILSRGEIVYHDTPEALKQQPDVLRQYLGLGL